MLRTRRVRSGLKMSQNVQFSGQMFFPTKYLRPYHQNYPQNHPKTPFWGTFQCKTYHRDNFSKSHVNGSTKLKLYSYTGIGNYLGCVKIFRKGCPEGAGPLNVNLGPPSISEAIRARKLKLKTQLAVVKYSLRVQNFFYARWRPGGCRALI